MKDFIIVMNFHYCDTIPGTDSLDLNSGTSFTPGANIVDTLGTDWPSVETLVRRHSLSLVNRSPDAGSLAEDLLSFKLKNQRSLLRDSIKDLSDVVLNFNSCQSTFDSSSEEEANENKSKKSKRGKKRGVKSPPSSDNLRKKQNVNVSPGQNQ